MRKNYELIRPGNHPEFQMHQLRAVMNIPFLNQISFLKKKA